MVCVLDQRLSNKQKSTRFYNGFLSSRGEIYFSLPHASSLPPLLYSVYTNDTNVLKQSVAVLYADDSGLFYSSTSLNEISRVLTTEIDVENMHCTLSDRKSVV